MVAAAAAVAANELGLVKAANGMMEEAVVSQRHAISISHSFGKYQ
jgi:hypothetical protein